MTNNLKEKLTDDKKILILFTVLLVFNIALYVNLFGYMVVKQHVDISVLHELVTIVSAIIILSFISTRLPKLKDRTDGSVYEIGYLIIMGLMSITVSYFNKSTNGESLWAPFLEMFRILSVILILTFIGTQSKSFKAILYGDRSRKAIMWQIIIGSLLGILASYVVLDINGVPANARGLVIMIFSLLGGPYVGIPVGIIAGVWRYSMGGVTALPCALATILAGVVGSLVFKWNNGRFLKHYKAALLMLLFSGFDMLLISLLTPHPQGLLIANVLYAPMTFAAVLGMLLFTLFLGEKKEEITINEELVQTIEDNSARISENRDQISENRNPIADNKAQISDNCARISDNSAKISANSARISDHKDILNLNADKLIEMSNELETYKNKSEDTEKELKEYKDKVDRLEQELNDIKSKLG